MQTFMPLPNYYDSMKCLDIIRLGNQVWREGLTLIRGKWKNHPACKMWKGHEYQLGLYLLEGIKVLAERRNKYYVDVEAKILGEMNKFKDNGTPPWMGNERFHSSHRKALLYKNFEWYKQFNWKESPDILNSKGKLNYYWPVT